MANDKISESRVCYKTGVISCKDEYQIYKWRKKFVTMLVRNNKVPQNEIIEFCDDLEAFLIDRVHFYQGQEEVFGQRFFFEFFPFFVLSNLVNKAYFKHHGYAGDYETIFTIYTNKSRGTNYIGKMLDRWTLNHSAAEAVRNRRTMIYNYLLAEIKNRGNVKAGSLACGPALEVADMSRFITKNQLKVDLIDIDSKALDFAKSILTEHGVLMNVSYIQKNVLELARNEMDCSLCYDVIYSLGLIDYFKDATIVRLLNWMYNNLSQDGLVILGNFREGHKDESFMKYILDWHLNNRSERRLKSLAKRSKFAESKISVISEEEGIQLFLVIRKS